MFVVDAPAFRGGIGVWRICHARQIKRRRASHMRPSRNRNKTFHTCRVSLFDTYRVSLLYIPLAGRRENLIQLYELYTYVLCTFCFCGQKYTARASNKSHTQNTARTHAIHKNTAQPQISFVLNSERSDKALRSTVNSRTNMCHNRI